MRMTRQELGDPSGHIRFVRDDAPREVDIDRDGQAGKRGCQCFVEQRGDPVDVGEMADVPDESEGFDRGATLAMGRDDVEEKGEDVGDSRSA
jgi:hypothetical protein